MPRLLPNELTPWLAEEDPDEDPKTDETPKTGRDGEVDPTKKEARDTWRTPS